MLYYILLGISSIFSAAPIVIVHVLYNTFVNSIKNIGLDVIGCLLAHHSVENKLNDDQGFTVKYGKDTIWYRSWN